MSEGIEEEINTAKMYNNACIRRLRESKQPLYFRKAFFEWKELIISEHNIRNYFLKKLSAMKNDYRYSGLDYDILLDLEEDYEIIMEKYSSRIKINEGDYIPENDRDTSYYFDSVKSLGESVVFYIRPEFLDSVDSTPEKFVSLLEKSDSLGDLIKTAEYSAAEVHHVLKKIYNSKQEIDKCA